MYTFIKKKHIEIALTACQLSVGLVSIRVCGNVCWGSIAAYIHTQWKIQIFSTYGSSIVCGSLFLHVCVVMYVGFVVCESCFHACVW